MTIMGLLRGTIAPTAFLAQLAERLPSKQKVVSSILTEGTVCYYRIFSFANFSSASLRNHLFVFSVHSLVSFSIVIAFDQPTSIIRSIIKFIRSFIRKIRLIAIATIK